MSKQRKRKPSRRHRQPQWSELVVRLNMLRPLTDLDRAHLAEVPMHRLQTPRPEYAEHAHLVNAMAACAALEAERDIRGPQMHVCVSERGWFFMHFKARWPKSLGGLFLAAMDANGRMLPPSDTDSAFLLGITNEHSFSPDMLLSSTAQDALPVWEMLELVKFTASLINLLTDYAVCDVGLAGAGQWISALTELDVNAPIIGEVTLNG